MPIIELPNGQNAEFPDSMPMEEIKSVIQKKFPTQPNNNLSPEDIGRQQLQQMIAPFKDPEKFNQSLGTAVAFLQPQIGLAELLGAKALPSLAKGAVNYLGRVGTGTAATLASGGANLANPNLGTQAKEAAGLNALFETLPPALGKGAKAVKGLIEKAQPAKYAEEIMQMLGKGKTVEENSKDLAQSISDAYQKRLQEASSKYNPILNKYGTEPIFETKNPSGIYAYTEKPKLNEDIFKGDLKELFQKYNSDSTLKNAHDLQSQLYQEIGALKKLPKNSDIRESIRSLRDARQTIQDSMLDFLRSKGKDVAKEYKEGSELFKENVVPYRINTRLRKIAQGEVKNPKNIHNIFSSPEKDIEKVIEDLSPEDLNRIMYSKVGKLSTKLSPEKLSQAIADSRNQGLSSYITPELEDAISTLNNRINNKGLTQKLLGSLAGYAVGAKGGHPLESSALGYLAAPTLAKALQSPYANNIFNTARTTSKSTRPISHVLAGNYLTNER